jgi:fatty acid desaturase
VKHASDVRQVWTVATYYALLASMFFVPACRNIAFLAAACAFSFLSAVVGHNTLHQGMFESKRMNVVWRYVLSFGGLFPISAVIPSHNLVHHHFDDDGQPDWAAPEHVRFEWNLLNIVHFPNVAGPLTFNGVQRWARLAGKGEFRKQYTRELVFAFGLTGVLLVWDFWTALFFVVVPQLWGARWFLRINIIQHDGCDTTTEWNHSRNFVGKIFNWFMMNNGYHTIHHNRAGMHWSELAKAHDEEVVPRMDPTLDEPSMLWYLARTYLFRIKRPGKRVGTEHEEMGARLTRKAQAEAEASASGAM